MNVKTEYGSTTSISPPVRQKLIYKKLTEIDEEATIKEFNENEIPNVWRENLNKISNLNTSLCFLEFKIELLRTLFQD